MRLSHIHRPLPGGITAEFGPSYVVGARLFSSSSSSSLSAFSMRGGSASNGCGGWRSFTPAAAAAWPSPHRRRVSQSHHLDVFLCAATNCHRCHSTTTNTSNQCDNPENARVRPDDDSDDDLDVLPARMLHTPATASAATDEQSSLALRLAKTQQYIDVICTTPDMQMARDMIHAGINYQTLQEKHLEAMLRRLRSTDAEYCTAQLNRREVPQSSVMGSPSPSRRSLTSSASSSSSSMAPQRRMKMILEDVLHERYYCAPTESSEDSSRRISDRIFNRFLAWVLERHIRRVRELAAQDRFRDCAVSADELCDEDENDVVDTADTLRQNDPAELLRGDDDDDDRNDHVAMVSHAESPRLTGAEIWRFAALMELHGVAVESELLLDALVAAASDQEAAYRRHHSGEPLADEIHKNRLEFIDRQRSSIRDAALRRTMRPRPQRDVVPLFVGAPPPPVDM